MAKKKGTIGARIVLEGAKEYEKALKEIAAEERVLASEMKKTQAQYKDSADSEEALRKKREVATQQLEVQKKKYEEYRKAIEHFAKQQQECAEQTENLREQLQKEQAKLQEMESSNQKSQKAIDAQAEAVEKLQKELEKSQAGYDAAGRKMQEYQTKSNNAMAGIYNLQDSLNGLQRELNETEGASKNSSDALGNIGDSAQKAGDKVSGWAEMVKSNIASEAIIDAAKAIASGIRDIATAAVESGSAFEASMSQVAATMGITASEIESGSAAYSTLTEAAKQCGETTKYSASEAGEALNYLALAGYDAEKAAATLPRVLNLAAAGGLNLATASDLVTDAMAALGMETSDLDKYIDEMAKTSQKSNTNVQQLGEATLVAAGAVSTAKMDLETMNAELGVLANNGIKGAEGGTHLRNVILSLSAPTDNGADKLQALGVATQYADGNMRDLNDILIDLNYALADMGSAQKAQAIKTIFNKTDIAAVNALLKGTNGEFDALKKQIENASGAAADMAETMNDNLKGKVTILQSTLEALGISAYEIFDDELKGSVEAATDAVSRLNKSVKEGDMNASLNKLADSMGNFIESGADLAEEVLPEIIDAASWCIDNFELIASLVMGIVAANAAMGTVVPLIQGAQAAWIAYKTANEGATAAQWLMNAAMSANPVGLIVTGLAAATAALVTYSALTANSVEDAKKLTAEQQKIADSANKVSDSVKKTAEERRNDVQSMEAQKAGTRNLVRELKNYIDEQGRVIDVEKRAGMIIDELNTLLPELNLAYDEQTGMLNMSTEELERNTDALWAQAEALAYQEQMTEIMRERIEVETEMAKMEDEVTAARERQTEAQNRYHDAYNELLAIEDETSARYREQIQVVQELNLARMDEAERCSAIAGPYNELENRLADLDEEYGIVNGKIEDSGRVMEEAEGAVNRYKDTSIQALQLTEEAYEELYKAVEDSITGQIKLFDEFEQSETQHKDSILANMQSQVDGMQDWADDMEALARKGIDEGLLKHLAEMGPEGAGYVKGFLEMSARELEEANQLYRKSLELPSDAASDILETYEKTGYQAYMNWTLGGRKSVEENAEEMRANGAAAAQNSIDGFTDTIDENLDAVGEAGKDIADAYMDEMEGEDGFDAHSPSRRTAKTGQYVVEGLIRGIEENIELAEESARDAAKRVSDAFEEGINHDIFYSFGIEAAKGLAEGIRKGQNEAVSAAEGMANAVSRAAKNKLQISSPSKVFAYFGEMSAEGFAEGFENYLPRVDQVMEGLYPKTQEVAGNSTNNSTMNNTVSINVYGAEGQDVEELAEAVNEQLTDTLNSKEAAWQ